MTTNQDLARLAEAATGGEWRSNYEHVWAVGYRVASCDWDLTRPSGQCFADAAYIAAASPSRILALLAENAALREAEAAWKWLSERRALSLEWNGPVYGDDEGPDEWRVYRETGGINDREWTQVGAGATALEAVLAARSALQANAGALEEKGSSSAAEQVALASELPLGQAQHFAGEWSDERALDILDPTARCSRCGQTALEHDFRDHLHRCAGTEGCSSARS